MLCEALHYPDTSTAHLIGQMCLQASDLGKVLQMKLCKQLTSRWMQLLTTALQLPRVQSLQIALHWPLAAALALRMLWTGRQCAQLHPRR